MGEKRAREELGQIIESARQLGVELDEEEALQWLTQVAAAQQGELVVDADTGVYGHRVTMLDFTPGDLAYFREVGKIVEFHDEPGVETALALSGSAAQSKIQTHPGDCDYFERINIQAPTREEACRTLARVIRAKALATTAGPTYQLTEVKFGSYPTDLVRQGRLQPAGSPISWTPAEVRAGQFPAQRPDGEPVTITWEEAALDPGWCKLDWLVMDPVRRQMANASNMLDSTWEGPDGSITPLDGYLDGYFQEVYLEADSVPLFTKLVKHMSGDALDDYVQRLEREVRKYVTKEPNYGKAAKRMYNIFRLTGRYADAAFLRELFDEPATVLYQVWALIKTIDEACEPDSTIPTAVVLDQVDHLIVAAVKALEGDQEAEIVKQLLRLRETLERQEGHLRAEPVAAARAEAINLINNFFHEKLQAIPAIKRYIDGFRQ